MLRFRGGVGDVVVDGAVKVGKGARTWMEAGGRSAITLRQDGADLVGLARTDRGVPGFEPHQPIPSSPRVSVAVPLTC